MDQNIHTNKPSSLGEIHFTSKPEELLAKLSKNIKTQNLRIYNMDIKIKDDVIVAQKGSLKINNAREIIAEAYINSVEEKTIIINATEYTIEAQNALLKILEEPPMNIKFILIAKNKNSILDTIRSRLICRVHKEDSSVAKFPLDMTRLNIESIYNFCKNSEKISSKDEIRERIQSLLFALKSMDFRFDSSLLQAFDNAILQNQNDEREAYIFLPLLLRIYLIKKENTK